MDKAANHKKFSASLADNIAIIEGTVQKSVDFQKRLFTFHETKDIQGVCYYVDGLINDDALQEALKALMIFGRQQKGTIIKEKTLKQVLEKMLYNTSAKVIAEPEEAITYMLSGLALIMIDGYEDSLVLAIMGWDARAVDEPATESVVRGPRDGFTETIRTNTALIRRRIRDPLLCVDGMKVGTKTKTDINILYLKGTVMKGLVEEVKRRISAIKIDSILESGYIEELIEDAPYSPFTTIQSTERPDKAASAILEGRVVIVVDNTPFALVVPTVFWQFLQASDDYYSRYWVGSFFRIVRYFAFLISLTLPSIYVMLVTFQQEMIPSSLAFTIASGREVVPFSVLTEALIMEMIFELMREAGLRMPKVVGQAVSIVGSLIIGQAAVSAGLVSPFMVIIVAVTGIAAFAIPNYAASFSLRVIRFPLIIASGTMGLLGFSAVFFIIVIHALSIHSFGEPYLAPVSPLVPSDMKDLVLRAPWWRMLKRPRNASGDEERLSRDQEPITPEKAMDYRPDGGNQS